ncbi:1-deoxypentalenic acid 11-beta-hydroxylase [Frankliniella fusca]|uniref:1-deoxypentalenic acid 11-beta-hydroxylase n=1 Tax=Frankliniella fusca TaxID=407009 RepID=A0AAE1H7C9_9NEOP|nr:1-deoxypentalenic acid 11-beta-hydroxylase [Frankliniella fusca]
MEEKVIQYYVNQAGSGVGNFYAGAPYQKGYSIGGFLGGLFRTVLPFLTRGAKVVGQEALRAGSHILADAAAGESIGSSAKRHAAEASDNLLKKLAGTLQGKGIKRRRATKRLQLKTSGTPATIKRRRVFPDIADVFQR